MYTRDAKTEQNQQHATQHNRVITIMPGVQ